MCDGHGHPLHYHLSAGQDHESTSLKAVLEGVDAHLCDGSGKPVPWPVSLGGDKGYRAAWIDEYLLDLGIEPVIPSKENEDRNARPVEFDREKYRRRNIVERLIGWLKAHEGVEFTTLSTAANRFRANHPLGA